MITSNELKQNRERATPMGGKCVNGKCECTEADATLERCADGRYGYGCGDCSVDQKVVDGACGGQATTAARFLTNSSLFDQCDSSLQPGFTPYICKRGKCLSDEKVWESEIDGSCKGHGQCLVIRKDDEQCDCERGFLCPDCSLSMIFDVQLFGARCGDYVNGARFCRTNEDCHKVVEDRDTLEFVELAIPPTSNTQGSPIKSSPTPASNDGTKFCLDVCRFEETCDAVLWDRRNGVCFLRANKQIGRQ